MPTPVPCFHPRCSALLSPLTDRTSSDDHLYCTTCKASTCRRCSRQAHAGLCGGVTSGVAVKDFAYAGTAGTKEVEAAADALLSDARANHDRLKPDDLKSGEAGLKVPIEAYLARTTSSMEVNVHESDVADNLQSLHVHNPADATQHAPHSNHHHDKNKKPEKPGRQADAGLNRKSSVRARANALTHSPPLTGDRVKLKRAQPLQDVMQEEGEIMIGIKRAPPLQEFIPKDREADQSVDRTEKAGADS